MRNYEIVCEKSKFDGLTYTCIFDSLESAKRFIKEHFCIDEYESISIYDYVPFSSDIKKIIIK